MDVYTSDAHKNYPKLNTLFSRALDSKSMTLIAESRVISSHCGLTCTFGMGWASALMESNCTAETAPRDRPSMGSGVLIGMFRQLSFDNPV